MGKIKKFGTWVNEDFASVGVAPAGNVTGMGPVVPPTATTLGSGDAWPSLGAPATQAGAPKSKKRKKAKTKSDKHKEKQVMKNSLQMESVINGPTFSIRDTKPGEIVEVEGEEVEIVDFTSWTKNEDADCMSFSGKLVDTGKEVKVRYDDGKDGYIFA